MNKMTKWFGLAALALVFAFPAVSFAQGGSNGGQPPMQQQAGMNGGKKWHGKANFPAIRMSLRMLLKTKNVLEHGKSIFGGHRVQAIQAVDQAIAHCKEALEYAKTHKPGKQ